MLSQASTASYTPQGLPPPFPVAVRRNSSREQDGVRRERAWRDLASAAGSARSRSDVLASRWTDAGATPQVWEASTPEDRYVLSVALRPTRLTLASGTRLLAEGAMPAGTLHVTGPARKLRVIFQAPCDFVHLAIRSHIVEARQAAESDTEPFLLDGLTLRDSLASDLARSLVEGNAGADIRYIESVGRSILARLLAVRAPQPRVVPLSAWRLRRVKEHVAANISEPITLSDLAEVAGLSRMHFAAQFRAAAGCRPHDYLLGQRVECAKSMLSTDMPLVEVALGVGFQAQSHFSTVFKRLTGQTPGHWRRHAIQTSGPTGYVSVGA